MLKSSTPWDDHELEQLRNLYLAHKSCKNIAHALNRSYESVSKALSRYGMRVKRPQKPRSLITQPSQSSQKSDLMIPEDLWVEMKEVLAYLERHRIFMSASEKSLFLRQSPEKQLFLANKMRLLKGESIFMVEGVTCA